jgi:hypothetical protein
MYVYNVHWLPPVSEKCREFNVCLCYRINDKVPAKQQLVFPDRLVVGMLLSLCHVIK